MNQTLSVPPRFPSRRWLLLPSQTLNNSSLTPKGIPNYGIAPSNQVPMVIQNRQHIDPFECFYCNAVKSK
jgi:hypothetical protein